jgi:hypothetical protein
MGAKYIINKTQTALNTSKDSLTITAPSTRALKVSNIRIYGFGTASAANEIGISRSTVGTTPTAITPQPLAVGSAAASFTSAGLWTTDPTLGVMIDRVSVNSNGGVSAVAIGPGNEIEIPPSGQISFRSVSGTGIVTISVTVEEVG